LIPGFSEVALYSAQTIIQHFPDPNIDAGGLFPVQTTINNSIKKDASP
jgi:hypothetical protein